jgi:hypothetical protein
MTAGQPWRAGPASTIHRTDETRQPQTRCGSIRRNPEEEAMTIIRKDAAPFGNAEMLRQGRDA